MFKFELGSMVTDAVTGFTGVVLARAEYVYETATYRVQPTTNSQENKLHKAEWIAEGRLTEATEA